MKIMCFDVESGGVDSRKHSLLAVGALVGDLDSGKILDKFEVFHKLPSLDSYTIDRAAQEVHSITKEECFEKGLFKEQIQGKLVDLYHNHNCVLIGGHNISFDIRFISRQIFEFGEEDFTQNFTYRILDSMTLIRLFAGVDNMKTGSSLKQTVKSLKIDMSDVKSGTYHSALYDTIASFRILYKFRKLFAQEEIVKHVQKI